MNDILHKYSAGEFIEWLVKQDVYKFTDSEIIETESGDSFVQEVFNEDKLTTMFIKSVQKFSIVKRGHILYIHDNESCKDIMQLHFNDDSYEHIQEVADNVVTALNNREMNFIGKKHHCR